jgi:transposase-like protein
MDFPISNLMDREACLDWIGRYFHPEGMKCPHCGADFERANWFRRTKRSELDVYRCKECQGIYNLYSGTVFEGRYFRPEQTVLFIRAVCQGKSTAQVARELGISRTTATEVRQRLQANAERAQSQEPLSDLEVEADEMFQNAGEKRGLAR